MVVVWRKAVRKFQAIFPPAVQPLYHAQTFKKFYRAVHTGAVYALRAGRKLAHAHGFLAEERFKYHQPRIGYTLFMMF